MSNMKIKNKISENITRALLMNLNVLKTSGIFQPFGNEVYEKIPNFSYELPLLEFEKKDFNLNPK